MIIKIDVDGVIRDMLSAICEIYNIRFGKKLTPDDIVDYDINTNFTDINKKVSMKPTDFFFKCYANQVFETVSKPFDGVNEAIDRLRHHGHKVVIVTWQFNLNNIMYTLNFLEKYGIKYDDICFTRDKWLINGDYLIDDNPEFIMDERDKSKKILVDAPYNRNVGEEYKRVKSLKEAVDYIISEESNKGGINI